MGQRRRAREHALQMLFQLDLTEITPEQVFPQFWSGHASEEPMRAFSEWLVVGVRSGRTELDRMIADSAQNWRMDRMAVVDRNVLRMALYEMMNDPGTPQVVVIDEAIEVAKKYGSAESGGFINGILDSIRKKLDRRGTSTTDVDESAP